MGPWGFLGGLDSGSESVDSRIPRSLKHFGHVGSESLEIEEVGVHAHERPASRLKAGHVSLVVIQQAASDFVMERQTLHPMPMPGVPSCESSSRIPCYSYYT